MAKYTDFGKQVKKALIEKELSTTKFAGEIGISYSYLLDILKGGRRGKKYVHVIAEKLGIELPKEA